MVICKKVSFFVILVILLCGNSNLTAQWSAQTSGTASTLYDIHFLNSNKGWISGANGTILVTTDGGDNWAAQTSGTTETLHGLYMLDASNGFISGYNGTILKTVNGGTNWTGLTTGTTKNLTDIHFFDSDTGWAVGLSGFLVKTTDGGTSWDSLGTGVAVSLMRVYFADDFEGWIVGYSGTIRYTADGGTNWAAQTSGTAQNLQDAYFVDSNTGWVVGNNGTILKTTDGGTNWNAQTSGTTEVLYNVHFYDANAGWVAGANGTILRTIDGGTTWISQTSGTANHLYFLWFNDKYRGWSSGAAGTMLEHKYFINYTAFGTNDSTISSATITDTIKFTTTDTLHNTDEIVLTYPSGFTFTGPGVDGGSSFTGAAPAVESNSSNEVVLNSTGTVPPGNQTLILTGVNNPASAHGGDTLVIVARENAAGDTIMFADASPAILNIVGTLTQAAADNPISGNSLAQKAKIGGTAIEITAFKLAAAGENVTVTQITVTPTFNGMLTGEISNIDIYYDADGNGTVNGGEVSVATPADDAGSGAAVNITLNHTITAGASNNFIVTADISTSVETTDDIKIDVSAASSIIETGGTSGQATTKSGGAITGFTHEVTIPYLNLTGVTFDMDTTGNPADTVTIAFTTYAALAANDTIKVEFPATFTFTGAAVDAANTTTTTGNKPTVDSSSDSTILLVVPGNITAGNQSLVLTGINNPSSALKDVEITLQTFRQGGQDTVHYADQTPVNFDIRGTLQLMTADYPIIENRMDGLATAGDTNVVLTTFRLAALGEQSILSQIQVTPTYKYMTTAEINLIDIYKDLNGDGYIDTNEPSIGTAPVNDSGSGTTVAVNVSDTVAEGEMNYMVVAAFTSTIGDGDSVRIDVEDNTNITASGIISQVAPYGIGSAITGYYHKATPPVINILSTTLTKSYFGAVTDLEVEFTTNQNLDSLSDEIVVIFPSQLDITNIDFDKDRTVTRSGQDPYFNISESSGDTLVLDIRAAETKGSHKLYFINIQNPDSVHNNLNLEIYTRLDDNTLVDSVDLSPARFDIVGKLSLHEAQNPISTNNLSDLSRTGGTSIPVIAFQMIRQKEEMDFSSFSLTPHFTGMSSAVIQKIDIYEDVNANGSVDAGENSITNGTGDDNGNGQMIGINTPGYTMTEDTMNYIVTVDLSSGLGITDSLTIVIPRLENSSILGAVTGSTPYIFKPALTGITHVVEGFELSGLSDTTLVEGQDLSITPQYVTSYSGTPVFSEVSFPDYAHIDSTTGLFFWAPEFAQAGLHELIYKGYLNGVISIDTFYVQVGESNVAGTIIADSSDINGNTGGTVNAGANSLYSGHTITIPPGAFTGNKSIIIRKPDQSVLPATQLNQVPSAVEFIVSGEGSGYVFDDSVTITLEYKPFEIMNRESRMRIHLWDEVMGIWKRVRGSQTINFSANTIRTKIKHFSVYGVIETADITAEYSMGRGWNMLSVPVYPVDVTDPEELLSDDIYPFRLQEYNSNIYFYSETESKWIVPDIIDNGIGYIIYGFFNTQIDIEGANEYSDVNLELSYTGSNGWHLLGNPYVESISWDNDIAKGAGIDNQYYKWYRGQYIFYPGGGADADISPWQGFFVRTTTDGAQFDITFPGISKASGVHKPEIDWRIQLIAESGELKDLHNYLGSGSISYEGYDVNDVYELVPLDGEFITAFFPHEDWEVNPANYTQDIRYVSDQEVSWDFKVMTNSNSGSVDLRWQIPEEFPADLEIIMTVPGTGEKIDMRKKASFTYDIPVRMQKRNNKEGIPFVNNDPTNFTALYKSSELYTETFTVTVGKGLNDDPALIPDSYFLKQNYPNPFNPDTNIEFGLPQSGKVTLKIYNILGQEIRTLVNGDFEAGVHRVRWDARNQFGIHAASGIYIYRIQAGSFNEIRKMILIK